MKKYLFLIFLIALFHGRSAAVIAKPDANKPARKEFIGEDFFYSRQGAAREAQVLVYLRLYDNCNINISLQMNNKPAIFDFLLDKLQQMHILSRKETNDLYVYKFR